MPGRSDAAGKVLFLNGGIGHPGNVPGGVWVAALMLAAFMLAWAPRAALAGSGTIEIAARPDGGFPAEEEALPPSKRDLVRRMQKGLADLGLYSGPRDGRPMAVSPPRWS